MSQKSRCLCLSSALLLFGCSDRTGEVVVADVEAQGSFVPSPEDYSYLAPEDRKDLGVSFDVFEPGVNHLAGVAEVAVIANITSVSEPTWNSLAWAPDDDGIPNIIDPFFYRDVEAVPVKFLWGDALLGAEPFSFVAYGTGVEGGFTLDFSSISITIDELLPPLHDGQDVVLLLSLRQFETPKGGELRWQPVAGSFLSVWTLEGDLAVSLDPTRNLPLLELEQRLVKERKAGLGNPTAQDALEPDSGIGDDGHPEIVGPQPSVTSPCGTLPVC